MRPRSVVVFDVGQKDTTQMALVEDHDVVEAFATDRTDHALDVRVLPGRAWRRDDFRDPHRLDPAAEVPGHTRHRDRAADSAERCPTGTPRLLDAIASAVGCRV